MKKILVTGGAGYVGCVLVPKLLETGYSVRVLDLMLFGNNLENHPNLEIVWGDIRSEKTVDKCMEGIDSVIHLACISNDPSCDLDPDLTKSINYDAFSVLLETAQRQNVRKFILASSSSVYGISDAPEVTEDLPLNPLTDYSRSKVFCEKLLQSTCNWPWTTCIVRPATVCGYSPRMRFDVIVNALTRDAWTNGEISVHGGSQFRPNIHIDDICNFYLYLLKYPEQNIHNKIFNIGGPNFTIDELANIVNLAFKLKIKIKIKDVLDPRSYRISSKLAKKELYWEPTFTIRRAILDIIKAFEYGKFPQPFDDKFSNVATLKLWDHFT